MNLECVNAYDCARVEWWKHRKNKSSDDFTFLQAGLDPGKESGEKRQGWIAKSWQMKAKKKLEENWKYRLTKAKNGGKVVDAFK